MDKKWKEELRLGWLRQVPVSALHSISPALAVVRPSEQRAADRDGRLPKARICSDLSHGSPSINELTPHWPFRLVKMRRVIAKLRSGWRMGVNDVSSAYRRFAWNADMLRYTGLKWRGTTVADTRLTFGSSAAPAMCQFYTQSVVETITRRAVSELGLAAGEFFIHVYLDDVIHAASSEGACLALARLVQEEFAAHGLPLKADKSQGPALSRVVYLGWRLCTETETMALTSEKTNDLRRCCQQLLRSRGVRLRAIRSLAGKLAWAAAAMPGATCRLQALWRDVSRRQGRADPRALSTDARQTLEWFVGAFRETVAVQCHFRDWTQSVIVVTDAAGELTDSQRAGFGALVIGPSEFRLFQQAWSDEERALFESSEQDSSVLREALAAYLAAKRSQDIWSPPRPETGRGLPVLFITDSLAGACAILKGSSSRSPASSPFNRSLLNDLMLDMADLFAAARSDYAAWWVRRDQLAGVDWLSRTNLHYAEDAAAAGADVVTWHRAANDAGIANAGYTGVDVGDDVGRLDAAGNSGFVDAGDTDDGVDFNAGLSHAVDPGFVDARRPGDGVRDDAGDDVGVDARIAKAGNTGCAVGDEASSVNAGNTSSDVGDDAGSVTAGDTGFDVSDDAGMFAASGHFYLGCDSTDVSAGIHPAVHLAPGCPQLARLLARARCDPSGMTTEDVPPLHRQRQAQRVAR